MTRSAMTDVSRAKREVLAGLFALAAASGAGACTTYRTASLPGPFSSPNAACEGYRTANTGTASHAYRTAAGGTRCRIYLADGSALMDDLQSACTGVLVPWSDYTSWLEANPPASAPPLPAPAGTPVVCNGACTVTHAISADVGVEVEDLQLTEEKIGDLLALFSALLSAGVLVGVVKWLYSYFRLDHHES